MVLRMETKERKRKKKGQSVLLFTIAAAVIDPAGRERECVVQKGSVHIVQAQLCYE